MKKIQKLEVQGTPITLLEDDFVSLTDLARRFDQEEPKELVSNWMRLKDTVELLGAWELMHNPDFKGVEFDTFKTAAGSNRFRLSPSKWAETTGAIGIVSKRGRYDSGTFAHRDLALAFCSWLSPVFHLFVIKEFQRLKSLENPEWDLRRSLAKVNYALHTGAVKKHIVPLMKGRTNTSAVIALTEEADMLNLAVFGVTAAQWRTENLDLVAQNRNIRDVADLYQLLVLANMESYNETLIHYQLSKEDRFYELEKAANRQLEALLKMNRFPEKMLDSPNLRLKVGENHSEKDLG